MAVNLRRSHGPQAAFLSVLLGCIVLTASAVTASNQETTAEPSMVTFTFEGEFMFLAQMEFEVFDSNQNSVLIVNQDENTDNHQLVLAPGQYNVEARANAGPLSIRMDSMEFDSQEYSHVTLTVQYVLVTEVVSILALISLTLSLLRISRRLFGRLRRKRPTSISSNAHVEPTDDMLAEQDPKSDADLEDALKEQRELFSDRLHTRGDFLPPPQGGPTSLSDVIDYYARQDKPVDIDIPFWPPDDADSTGKDLWYQFKETESGTTVVELVSEADYDTRIPVYKLPYEERKRAEEESLPEQDPKSDGVRIHLGPSPPEEEKVLRERKSAEEESLPEQEPVDDPYYPGAPGDRELAIKYGLEWIKTPEEEKILRELWELENERRKKRGSILISWLVWKEMRRQDEEEVEKGNQEVAERLAADEEERLRQNWLKTPEGKKAAEDAKSNYLAHARDAEVRRKMKQRRLSGGGISTPSSPTCVDCGHPKDKSHGTGGWEDPFSKEHTRALLEKDRNRVHHDETENCPRVGCGTGCRGIPILNPIDILDWARFDLPNIKASNDAQFTIPDEWEPQDGWEGGKISGGDLNYYGFGMACAYNCLTWEQTKLLIRIWNQMQGIWRGSKELVPPQMLTAAKAGFDEERKRYPERCPEDKSAFDKVVGDLVEDGLLILDEGKKNIEEEWRELKEKYNSIFGNK